MLIMCPPPSRAAFLLLFSQYQVHVFHTAAVLLSGGNDINTCCVDTAVTENIG